MPPIIGNPGDGERYQRENRVVTIKVDLPQLSIHELEFDTSFQVAQHTHDHVDAMYVLDGVVELLFGDQVVPAGPGTLTAVPPDTLHGFRNPGPGKARGLILHAPDSGFAEMVRNT
jgi:quercetin dioxygenase-like cupin family protein